MLNFLQPQASPAPSMNTTPQATPPASRPTSSQVPELLVCSGERDDIPQVVLFPPEEEESQFCEPAHFEREGAVAGPAQNFLHLAPPSEGKAQLVFSMGFLSVCLSVSLYLSQGSILHSVRSGTTQVSFASVRLTQLSFSRPEPMLFKY